MSDVGTEVRFKEMKVEGTMPAERREEKECCEDCCHLCTSLYGPGSGLSVESQGLLKEKEGRGENKAIGHSGCLVGAAG